MKRSRKYLMGLAVVVVATTALLSFGATLSVVSSNNGTGLFSWSFTKGDEAVVWRLDGTLGTIGIQAYGVEQVFTPSGWAVTNDGSDFLQWSYTNGTWYIENTAVVFSVQSVFTNATLYTNAPGEFFPEGGLVGTLCQSNHTPIAPGTETYVIIGPQPRPNFSSFSISNSEAVFQIEEMMGRTGYLERTVDLVSNVWQEATNFTVEGLSTNILDSGPATTDPLFYRLRFTR